MDTFRKIQAKMPAVTGPPQKLPSIEQKAQAITPVVELESAPVVEPVVEPALEAEAPAYIPTPENLKLRRNHANHIARTVLQLPIAAKEVEEQRIQNRLNYNKEQAKKVEAATKIQSLFRGKKNREKVANLIKNSQNKSNKAKQNADAVAAIQKRIQKSINKYKMKNPENIKALSEAEQNASVSQTAANNAVAVLDRALVEPMTETWAQSLKPSGLSLAPPRESNISVENYTESPYIMPSAHNTDMKRREKEAETRKKEAANVEQKVRRNKAAVEAAKKGRVRTIAAEAHARREAESKLIRNQMNQQKQQQQQQGENEYTQFDNLPPTQSVVQEQRRAAAALLKKQSNTRAAAAVTRGKVRSLGGSKKTSKRRHRTHTFRKKDKHSKRKNVSRKKQRK